MKKIIAEGIIFLVFFFMVTGIVIVDRQCAKMYGNHSIFDINIKKSGNTYVLSL